MHSGEGLDFKLYFSAYKEQGGNYSSPPFNVNTVLHENIGKAFKGAGI